MDAGPGNVDSSTQFHQHLTFPRYKYKKGGELFVRCRFFCTFVPLQNFLRCFEVSTIGMGAAMTLILFFIVCSGCR